ncbi:MAG: Eco57I restriction-modification methylase domain-containing protein [Saprospiraceae bacterium]
MVELKETSWVDNQIEKEYSKLISLEHRKKYAQFFTPLPIASLMADWLLGYNNLNTVLEPAFGLGIFSRILLSKKSDLTIKCFEVDKTIFSNANEIFFDQQNVRIHLEDYMYNDWDNKYDGIICNPPYFKFHDYDNKAILHEVEKRLKIKFNGFTNLYTLFLIKSINQLNFNGRIAYIIPSEFLNSDYGKLVKSALIKSKILRHIIIVDFEENVFDDALTTSCILLCSNDQNYQKIKFSNIKKIEDLITIQDYIKNYPNVDFVQTTYNLTELNSELKWRKYYQVQNGTKFRNLIPFANVAKVVRGIATGANEYFTFSKNKAMEHGIGHQYLLPCICKSIDVNSNFFSKNHFEELANNNKQAFLLNALGSNDRNVLKYLELGENVGVNTKYLTASRNPWYSLENRLPAPIWVSVFNRNGLKFVRNEAMVSNLTTFHCIYPVQSNLFNTIKIDILFAYLLTEVAKVIFEDNRREYGNGLQKFEPNDLNEAMMLDLSLLDMDTENKILGFYSQYRESSLKNSPDKTLLGYINEIFKTNYSLC